MEPAKFFRTCHRSVGTKIIMKLKKKKPSPAHISPVQNKKSSVRFRPHPLLNTDTNVNTWSIKQAQIEPW